MIGRLEMVAAARSAIALCCLVAAGCAGIERALTEEPVPAVAPVASTSVDRPLVATPPESVPAPTATAPVPAVAAPKAPPVVIAAPIARETVPEAATAPVAKPPPVAIAAPVAPAPQAVPEMATAPVATPPAVALLDFAALGTRLRETKTIGVLTKLAVKNQADDLVDKFRAYHQRRGTATLPELRQSYDMLLLKVLSLLQDSDPPLAQDIVQSRTAIWDILADPRKFTESNLMAGVTT